jgi:hypothetical protein
MKNKKLIIIAGIVALLVVSGLALGLMYSGSPKDKAVIVAEKALMATVDYPNSVRIIGISHPDSVYGRDYITPQEKLSLSMTMMKIHEKVMKETNGLENFNPKDRQTAEMMERQMTAMAVLRSLVPPEQPHGITEKPFSGWKVKVEYEARSSGGIPYRSEYWFILDKDAQCVIKSFEIPLL